MTRLILEKFPINKLLWAERLCSVYKQAELAQILEDKKNLIDEKTIKIFWERGQADNSQSSRQIQLLCREWRKSKTMEVLIQIWDFGKIPQEFLA